ncbi:flagellar FlbD family protein [Pseudogracilibacillus sp. ICA-222130]|uniref:flagellar FlbD family protein n=1 Tax=Pseudogracilibacillus sp. ICA-222130 TaxID=3134655 RepID=UPI0030BB2729
MIELTRLNGETFYLNPFMVEQVQSLPDTTITLLNGKKFVVQTNKEDVLRKILEMYQQVGMIGFQTKQVNQDE